MRHTYAQAQKEEDCEADAHTQRLMPITLLLRQTLISDELSSCISILIVAHLPPQDHHPLHPPLPLRLRTSSLTRKKLPVMAIMTVPTFPLTPNDLWNLYTIRGERTA